MLVRINDKLVQAYTSISKNTDRQMNLDNFYGSFDGIHHHDRAPGHRSETIISVIVPDRNDDDDDDDNDEKTKKKRLFTPSTLEYVKVLSFVYAILMTIMGLIFPLAEALTNSWMNSLYNAVFLTYQLIVGILFLLYLQFYLIRQKKSETKKAKDHNSKTVGSEDNIGNSNNNNNNNNLLSPTGDQNSSKNSSPVTHPKHVVSLIRRTSISQPSSQIGTPNLARRMSAIVPEIDQQTISHLDEDINSDESLVWMDVSKFGSIFSHEGSSLFLRIGVMLFSLGNMVYYALEIVETMGKTNDCGNTYIFGWTFIPLLIFVLVQTFFLFKGANVHVSKHLPLFWYGMLHLISTNICLWFRIVIREIMEEFTHENNKHSDDASSDHGSSDHGSSGHDGSYDSTESSAENLSLYNGFAAYSGVTTQPPCVQTILDSAAVYLVPFVLEYSLIAVGTICYAANSVSLPTDSEGDMVKGLKNLIKVYSLKMNDPSEKHETQSSDGVSGHPALTKSHFGLFAGMVLFAGTIISVALFFHYMPSASSPAPSPAAIFIKWEAIYFITDIAVHFFLLVGCILSLFLIRNLGYAAKPISTDDVLLLISMCGSCTYEIAVLVASCQAISSGNNNDDVMDTALRLTSCLVAAVQTVTQAIVLLCALRRYPSAEEHVTKMPGRGTFAFLIVGNVTVWVLRTLLAKNTDMPMQSNFYGSIAWILLLNVNLPLLLFFRFHCSVCFADVWHVAYAPLHRKIRKLRLEATPHPATGLSVPQIFVIGPTGSTNDKNASLKLQQDDLSMSSFNSGTTFV